jgi:hypothetical protein
LVDEDDREIRGLGGRLPERILVVHAIHPQDAKPPVVRVAARAAGNVVTVIGRVARRAGWRQTAGLAVRLAPPPPRPIVGVSW